MDDLICITTTIPHPIANKRKVAMINQFHKYNIPVLFNQGIIKNKKHSTLDVMAYKIINSMNLFKKTKFKYAIICDDDFCTIDNFMEELNATVQLLPPNWRCLHLCPGYLWGRKFRNKRKISKLNPEYDMKNIPYDKSGRFYIDCDPKTYLNKKFFLGGPVAFLINQQHVDSYLDAFEQKHSKHKDHDDQIFVNILNNHDFVCREPILGYEKEEGGSIHYTKKVIK
jgi:hypothetical protein